MLTAWDKTHETTPALPDFESVPALEQLRERVRRGELICPTCHQALWLRAGEVRIPHFAHRHLSDCPHGRVSEAVLLARRLLYRFFQTRIESGKLPAQVILEPVVAGLPKGVQVDLMLRRKSRPTVNVVLIDRNLKPEFRARLESSLSGKGRLFRPVFLSTRLRHPEDEPKLFLLDPTQREFRQKSEYDLVPPEHDWERPGTLHFIDPTAGTWTTLRRISLVHYPQAFRSGVVRASKLERLLWSEAHAEWAHEGEAEALKRFKAKLEAERKAAEERQRRQEADTAKWLAEQAQLEQRRWQDAKSRHRQPAPRPAAPASKTEVPCEPDTAPAEISAEVVREEEDPLPEWIVGGLVCVGCGKRTTRWQNAAPGKGQCVCRDCFASGVRLK